MKFTNTEEHRNPWELTSINEEKGVEVSLAASGCGSAISSTHNVTVTVYACGETSSPAVITTSAVVQSSLSGIVQSSTSTTARSLSTVQNSTSTASVPVVISTSSANTGTIVLPTERTTSVYSDTYISSAPTKSIETSSISTVIVNSTSIPLSTYSVATTAPSIFTSAPIATNTNFAYEMSIVGSYLYYIQDWNPSPLGLYITVC